MSTLSGKDTFVSDQREFERWGVDQRNEPESERDSNPFADLLIFLSDGYQRGTLLARALAFLWVLRPDLVAADGGAQSVDAVASKAGVSRIALMTAVRHLRTTAPELDQAMRGVHTSRARFLALAQMKAKRRELHLKDAQRMADARLELAHERVRKGRKYARDDYERRRLKVARKLLAMADPILKKAAADMREFDRSMGLKA